ncbi:MAG: hypothetical protein EOP00_31120 [Pedobacter sp.]|nr:MAG: hypothetical protein EOP00_31120 [Pedobacter sp.]
MKNIGYKITLVIALMIIGALAFKIYFKQPVIDDYDKKQSNYIDKAKTEAKIIAKMVDKKGYSVAVLERKKAILGNGDITNLPVSQSVLDSLRLDGFSKDKKLQQASLINASLSAKDLKSTKIIDSLSKQSFVYTDPYLTATYYPDTNGGKFDINYRLSLIRHDYKKRKNIFSGYKYYTDILSPDNRVTVNSMQTITIESPSVKKFGIGLQLGYAYNPSTSSFSPSIGLGISYNLIRF